MGDGYTLVYWDMRLHREVAVHCDTIELAVQKAFDYSRQKVELCHIKGLSGEIVVNHAELNRRLAALAARS